MIKKLITLGTIASVVGMMAPALAVAQTNVSTSLTKDTEGGQTPIVKAKWEAYGETVDNKIVNGPLDYYQDASTSAGAQINPTGVKNDNRTIAGCAVVTDPDGLADITSSPGAVYMDVFYPNVDLGEHHTPLPDQSGEACGAFMQEDKMSKLSKADGIELFCDRVRSQNNNLPTFEDGYNYDEICAPDGELLKETAAVYCTTKDLSYEDPSGDYTIWAVAQDKTGNQGTLEKPLQYLPLTAFETDFTSIAYGPVRLDTHKIISGDLTWGNDKASVRNVGNTRLAMKVWQNDMGFGKTDGNWNVKYDARVGSNAPFANYWPETTTTLKDELDLSELDEMDFSILVSKFPPQHEDGSYSGSMILSAVSKPHISCISGG